MSAKFPRGGEQTHSQPSVYYIYFSDLGARSERVVMICNRFLLILDNKIGILVIIDSNSKVVFI